ncbi:MAG TPA: UDP-N-acetylglucosamine 2-epimerase (non-hydrolyzing) [Pseudonocardiaceae bacterium]|jgi:UDP-N-acetylglucosamine 2-epimerase (non-hydrolysing)|nr:UDP-N-acetylglucosamine 2-epimerase (non-hydrolyzing) [Pseudonocardiaceae bacterium]
MDVLLLAGTRPEAIKIAPVALAIAERTAQTGIRPVIIHSGQHRDVVEQALLPFGLRPDEWLAVRRVTGSQPELLAGLLPALDEVLVRTAPAAVVVQGDTSTTLAGALAAFWRSIPVVHLEAGLRTGDLTAPFPEEGNRQLVSRIASLHLAPTQSAADALRVEALPRPEIVVTGNTVVDAARHMADLNRPAADPNVTAAEADHRRLVLVTVHRRESWGAPLDRILAAVRRIVEHHPDVLVLLPAHPNPTVRAQVAAALRNRVLITDPLTYPDLIRILSRSALVLTDSGGLQEEAPTFGVPVLILRDTTERREAVDAGRAWLVGTNPHRIAQQATRLLASRPTWPPDDNPYGDGKAAARVRDAVEAFILAPSTPRPRQDEPRAP